MDDGRETYSKGRDHVIDAMRAAGKEPQGIRGVRHAPPIGFRTALGDRSDFQVMSWFIRRNSTAFLKSVITVDGE
jgi:hypothetical protein